MLLLPEVPGHLLVDVLHHGLERGQGDVLRVRDRDLDLDVDLRLQVALLGGVPEGLAVEVLAEAKERVLLLPALDKVLLAVGLGVVARRVTAHPVRERLDDGRAVAARRAGDGILGRAVHGEDVVAVDLHARDPVGHTLDGEARARGLPFDGDADRPAVVAAEEDRGGLEDAGEVHPVVKLGRARRALAEEGQGDQIVLLHLRRPAEADGLRDLGADGRAHRAELGGAAAVVVGHLAALHQVLRVAVHVVRVHLERHAAPERGPELAVAREDPVLGARGGGRAEDGRLLAERADVEAHAALALERDEALVERPRQHHVSVEGDHQLIRELRIGRGIEGAVLAEHTEHLVAGRARRGGVDCRRRVGRGGSGQGHHGGSPPRRRNAGEGGSTVPQLTVRSRVSSSPRQRVPVRHEDAAKNRA